MTDVKTFTIAELAERWKCRRQVIDRCIRAEKLAAFRVGGRILRVTLDEVPRFEKAKAA